MITAGIDSEPTVRQYFTAIPYFLLGHEREENNQISSTQQANSTHEPSGLIVQAFILMTIVWEFS